MPLLEEGTWAFGNAVLPLTAATTNTLLEDADPALSSALDFLAWGIDFYTGDRLKAECAPFGLLPPGGVALKIATEPSPYLYSDQFKWPLFALYRKSDEWDEHTVVYDKSTSTWEFAYVLLSTLTPAQQDRINPILRAVASVMRRLSHQGWDPNYLNGAPIWGADHALTQTVKLLHCSYGGYEKVDTNGQYFRALTGVLQVRERERIPDGAFEQLSGMDVHVDADDPATGTTVLDVAQLSVGPLVRLVSPNSGPKAGGTPVTLFGSGFASDNAPDVTIGGVPCTGVVVVDALTIQCTTAAHAVSGSSLIADVVVATADGFSGTLTAGFTYTNP